ncbi:uncharacterized protein LOC62_03G004121 [Vanrija pseudolonga]|uniref:Uncharacterized protein n=1 Tax=Vanrija pseudolonga TaxID=143232 RepID=A0AAF1BK39_9TREE|nr:hypothetical protein LOC62_03G004121 [Vanrija pseudolonga]
MAPSATHPGGQDPVIIVVTEGPPAYPAADSRLSAYKLSVGTGASLPQCEATSLPDCMRDLRAIPRVRCWDEHGIMLVSSDNWCLLVPRHVIRSSSEALSQVLGRFKFQDYSSVIKFFNYHSETAAVLDAFFTFVVRGTFRFPDNPCETTDTRCIFLGHLCAFMDRYRCVRARDNLLNEFFVTFVLGSVRYLVEAFILGALARDVRFCCLVLEQDEARAVQDAATAARLTGDADLALAALQYPFSDETAYVRCFRRVDVSLLSRAVHDIVPNEYLCGLLQMLNPEGGVRLAERFAELMQSK